MGRWHDYASCWADPHQYSFEGMVGEKMVRFSFGGVAGSRLQTPSAGIGKP